MCLFYMSVLLYIHFCVIFNNFCIFKYFISFQCSYSARLKFFPPSRVFILLLMFSNSSQEMDIESGLVCQTKLSTLSLPFNPINANGSIWADFAGRRVPKGEVLNLPIHKFYFSFLNFFTFM